MRNATTFCSLVITAASIIPAFARAPEADNTAQNHGATRKDAVTAEKQSNDKSDVQMLADVRKAIMADNELSMNAKNAKILYSKGCVTLRGPVDSEAEKMKVESLAKSCTGVNSVKNLLTIAAKSR